MVGRTPLNRPKFDSSPQTATMSEAGTPYLALTCLSNAACCCIRVVRVRIVAFVRRALQVLIEREHQLRLASIALEDDGDRFEAVECLIERRLADAAVNRFRAHGGQPFRERAAAWATSTRQAPEQHGDAKRHKTARTVVGIRITPSIMRRAPASRLGSRYGRSGLSAHRRPRRAAGRRAGARLHVRRLSADAADQRRRPPRPVGDRSVVPRLAAHHAEAADRLGQHGHGHARADGHRPGRGRRHRRSSIAASAPATSSRRSARSRSSSARSTASSAIPTASRRTALVDEAAALMARSRVGTLVVVDEPAPAQGPADRARPAVRDARGGARVRSHDAARAARRARRARLARTKPSG